MTVNYRAKIYKGDYIDRQHEANEDQAICYFEQHFNSADRSAAYNCVIVGSNASMTSKIWGSNYSKLIESAFDIKSYRASKTPQGIVVGGFNDRGNGNLKHTYMPAILAEPMFLTNPLHWRILQQTITPRLLAYITVHSILLMFPEGGLVGLSIGHKYKKFNPNDLGCVVPEDLRESYYMGDIYEADIAEKVIDNVKDILETI